MEVSIFGLPGQEATCLTTTIKPGMKYAAAPSICIDTTGIDLKICRLDETPMVILQGEYTGMTLKIDVNALLTGTATPNMEKKKKAAASKKRPAAEMEGGGAANDAEPAPKKPRVMLTPEQRAEKKALKAEKDKIKAEKAALKKSE